MEDKKCLWALYDDVEEDFVCQVQSFASSNIVYCNAPYGEMKYCSRYESSDDE